MGFYSSSLTGQLGTPLHTLRSFKCMEDGSRFTEKEDYVEIHLVDDLVDFLE